MLYHKINTLWKRDQTVKCKCDKKPIIEGDYSCPEFENIINWHVTEKIDGTNIRIIVDKVGEEIKLAFGGKTERAQLPTNLLEHLQTKTQPKIISFVKDIGKDASLIFFGEGYGANIQKGGGLYSKTPKFILFDIAWNKSFVSLEAAAGIAKSAGIDYVPVISERMTKEEIIGYVKSKPNSLIAEEEKLSEGIIARANPLVYDRHHKPIMFKLKVSDYYET